MTKENKEIIRHYARLCMEDKNLSEMRILDKFLMEKRAEIQGFEKALNIIRGLRFLPSWMDDETLEIKVYRGSSIKPMFKTYFSFKEENYGIRSAICVKRGI